MSVTIDPTQRKGSPVKAGKVIGGSAGKKVVDMTGENQLAIRAQENRGLLRSDGFDKNEIANAVVAMAGDKKLYEGPPELPQILDSLMSHISGIKHYGNAGSGARFGFLGVLARRLPAPILIDNEDVANDLFPPNCKTFCVDPSGRMWIYSKFLMKCLASDQSDGLMTLPVLNHEHLHIALEHCTRMTSFDPRISNIAKDIVINPMVKRLYPDGTKFAKDFNEAWGNRDEDKRFENLAEETVAKILQSEAVEQLKEKGTIKIKLLEIVDGKIQGKTVHKAGKDEVLELDHVVVTVEEIFDANGNSVGDKIDTEFDCAIAEIEMTINKLKTRNRPGGSGSGDQQESLIDIPVRSNQPSEGGDEGQGQPGDGNDNSGDENEGKISGPRRVIGPDEPSPGSGNPLNSTAGHELNMEKLKRVLKKHGYDKLLEDIKPDSHNNDTMQQIIENSLTEAQREQERLGPLYPGAHINDYMRDVVKPALKHRVTWQQRIREVTAGQGPLLLRSMEEKSHLTLLDPKDMGFDDDEMPELPGLLPHKPESKIAVIIDSSGSMDGGRLVEAVSLIVGIREGADEMAPEIVVYSADTAMRGDPIPMTDEALAEALEKGFPVYGRGGTEVTVPLNQLMQHARENNITFSTVLYITDFGWYAPSVDALPVDLPPLVWVGIPSDYKASSALIKQLEEFSEVVCIDKDMTFDADAAAEKAEIRGTGLAP